MKAPCKMLLGTCAISVAAKVDAIAKRSLYSLVIGSREEIEHAFLFRAWHRRRDQGGVVAVRIGKELRHQLRPRRYRTAGDDERHHNEDLLEPGHARARADAEMETKLRVYRSRASTMTVTHAASMSSMCSLHACLHHHSQAVSGAVREWVRFFSRASSCLCLLSTRDPRSIHNGIPRSQTRWR